VAFECTKFVFSHGSVPNPAGELTILPQTPSCFKGTLLLRGRGGERRERGMGRGGEGKGGEETPPCANSWIRP